MTRRASSCTQIADLYSDLPPLVMSRVAFAKDVRSREYPGTYAATQEVPIIGMVHATVANQDVLDYTSQYGTPRDHLEARRILYPDYGGSWGAQLASFVPFGSSLGRLVGAAVGHSTNAARGFMAASDKSESDFAGGVGCDEDTMH